VLVSGCIDSHRANHVIRAELHAIEVDHQQVFFREVPLGQFLEQAFARLHNLAGNLTLGDADLYFVEQSLFIRDLLLFRELTHHPGQCITVSSQWSEVDVHVWCVGILSLLVPVAGDFV
jgi:hypothetical protein